MNINETFKFRGEIVVRALDSTGVCRCKYEFPNSITYTSALVVKDLLIQANTDTNVGISFPADHPADATRGFGSTTDLVSNPTYNAIRYMRVGTGTAQAVRQQFDLVSAHGVGDTSGTAHITEIICPTNSSVRFVATFGSAKANGANAPISEVSLWTRGNVYTDNGTGVSPANGGTTFSRMFARQIHPPISKDATLSLEYTWTIYFT